MFLECGCPAGSHVAPFRCLCGGIWPDLALLGNLGGSMGNPKGHYVWHFRDLLGVGRKESRRVDDAPMRPLGLARGEETKLSGHLALSLEAM